MPTSNLRVVRTSESKKVNKPPRCYKITLWLTAAEWLEFMAASSTVRAGKLSVNSYFRKAMGLDGADDRQTERAKRAAMAKMSTPPDFLRQRHRRAA